MAAPIVTIMSTILTAIRRWEGGRSPARGRGRAAQPGARRGPWPEGAASKSLEHVRDCARGRAADSSDRARAALVAPVTARTVAKPVDGSDRARAARDHTRG